MQYHERPLRRVERRYCPHCNKNPSLKTFKAHKRLYFNVQQDTWVHLAEIEGSADVGIHSSKERSSSPPQSEIDTENDDAMPLSPPAYDCEQLILIVSISL